MKGELEMSRLSVSFGAVSLVGLALGAACVEQTEEKPTPEDLEYVKQNLLKAAPAPQLPVNADLDGKVVYLGLDVSPNPAEAGKDVKLTHYWKVNVPTGEGWRKFTHANGPNKQGYLNLDHGPVRGKYPVTSWKAGDIVRDEHTFRLPNTWQHDKVEIYVGLWRRTERMTIKTGARDNEGRVLAGVISVKGAAPPPAPKKYLVRKVGKPIKLDGKLDEPGWKSAPSTGAFVNTLTGAAAEVKTEAKLLWDEENLYIGFENADTDVWASLTKRDDKLWNEEAIEVMIDADGNKKTYVEFQVAPNGTLFDTYLPDYRKYENDVDPKRKPYDWTSKLRAKVTVDGTLNKRDDKDNGWTVELAIALADVNGLQTTGGVKVPPALGDTWRLNMYRLDVPNSKTSSAAAWSAPMVGDFHALDKFGHVVFADENGELPAPPVAAPGHGIEAMKAALGGMQPAAGTLGTAAGGTKVEIEGGKKAPAAKIPAAKIPAAKIPKNVPGETKTK